MRGLASAAATLGVVLLSSLQPPRAQAGSHAPREYLDDQTAVTVTVVDEPLVFAYSRRDLAANARDYATLAAASVNRQGKISYVLILYFWSTVDPRLRDESAPDAEHVVLLADDRLVELKLKGHSAQEAGIGIPVHAPTGGLTPAVYGADLSTLRFLAETRHLALRAEVGPNTLDYELWEDRRMGLRAFVRHMNGEE